MSNPIENVSLYFREGSSDKVYHVQLESKGSGYVVNCQYGRRGSTLQTGTKTPEPVDLAKARKVYDRVIKEKKGKGYTEGENGSPFAATDLAGQVSGILPQLLNEVEEAHAELLLSDDDWMMQEKFDGKRLLYRVQRGHSTAINRRGLVVSSSSVIDSAVKILFGNSDGVPDGEGMGDLYRPFDLLEFDGEDLRMCGALERWRRLEALFEFAFAIAPHPGIALVPTAITTHEKRALWKTLREQRAEGAVFKRIQGVYVPGKPNSGGDQLKFKYKASATCAVAGQNAGKRSVRIAVLDPGGRLVEIGNVPIPANHDIPSKGDLIEVEYLYAYPNGGSLYQPVYKGPRTDKNTPDSYDSLKFKQSSEDDEAN